jgi:hypothetical protein
MTASASDVGATQPQVLPTGDLGQSELRAVPPRRPERTVGRHLDIGKVLADRITGAGNRTQTHAEIGVRVDLVALITSPLLLREVEHALA